MRGRRRRMEAGDRRVRRSQGLDGAARRPRSRGGAQDPRPKRLRGKWARSDDWFVMIVRASPGQVGGGGELLTLVPSGTVITLVDYSDGKLFLAKQGDSRWPRGRETTSAR